MWRYRGRLSSIWWVRVGVLSNSNLFRAVLFICFPLTLPVITNLVTLSCPAGTPTSRHSSYPTLFLPSELALHLLITHLLHASVCSSSLFARLCCVSPVGLDHHSFMHDLCVFFDSCLNSWTLSLPAFIVLWLTAHLVPTLPVFWITILPSFYPVYLTPH